MLADKSREYIHTNKLLNTMSDDSETESNSLKILGMEFAPINISLERRLQTFAVLYWISSILFQGVFVTVLLTYLFIYTSYWWTTVLYATWCVQQIFNDLFSYFVQVCV